MTTRVARRPRIVEPRCLRCRRPLGTDDESSEFEAHCIPCSTDAAWWDAGEAAHA